MARLKFVRAVRVFALVGIVAAAVAASETLVLGQTLPGLQAQTEGQFVPRVFKDKAGAHKYSIFVPAHYSPDKKWPVILYLHGAGERGTDGVLQTTVGLGPFVKERAATFPFLVVFPQCEDLTSRKLDGWLADTPDAKRALRILDDVERDYSVDRQREILTGLSMGGAGVWSIGSATASRWAGLLVVSGLGKVADAPKLKNTPIWVLHGSKDIAVPIDKDQSMVEAVRAAGGHPYFTALPEARHVIGHVVYSDDAVYQWMLNPQSEPQPENIVLNSKRAPTAAEMGFDINNSFVPAAVIPQAVFLRVNKDAIDSLMSILPEMVPQNALSGSIAGVHRSTHTIGMNFNIDVAGMNYHGELAQLRLEPHSSGWATLHVGFRNMVMEVPQSQVSGRLASATAGPMYVSIGMHRPVWLSVPLRPYVERGRIRFASREPRFEIPEDEYHVSTPSVEAHGLPFIRGRVSNQFSTNLVSGAYAKKSEVEQMVVRSVPRMIAMLEAKMDQLFATPRTIGSWPMPALQPRYMLWANATHIDESGVSVIVGMTISRPGFDSSPCRVRTIDRRSLNFFELPESPGIQVGVSGGLLEGITAAMIAADGCRSDLSDLNPIGFAPFENSHWITQVIPDLARYGDKLRVRTRADLVEPIQISADESDVAGVSFGSPNTMQPSKKLIFSLPCIRLTVDVKTTPDQSQWTPCAQIDVKLVQKLHMDLKRPDFDSRAINFDSSGIPEAVGTAQFCEGFLPRNPRIETDQIARAFGEGWRTGGQMQLLRDMPTPDMKIGSVKLRIADVGWIDPFTVRFYESAHTRVTNPGRDPIEYYIRGEASVWGGPYRLKPGGYHEFNVPYDLIVRYRTPSGEFYRTAAAGTNLLLVPADESYGMQSMPTNKFAARYGSAFTN